MNRGPSTLIVIGRPQRDINRIGETRKSPTKGWASVDVRATPRHTPLPEIVAPSSGAPPERLARVPYIRDSAGAFSVRKTPFLSDPISAKKLSPVRVPVLNENPVSAPIARSGPRRARFSTSYRAGFTNRPVTNRSQPQAACPSGSPLRPEPWQPRDTRFLR